MLFIDLSVNGVALKLRLNGKRKKQQCTFCEHYVPSIRWFSFDVYVFQMLQNCIKTTVDSMKQKYSYLTLTNYQYNAILQNLIRIHKHTERETTPKIENVFCFTKFAVAVSISSCSFSLVITLKL